MVNSRKIFMKVEVWKRSQKLLKYNGKCWSKNVDTYKRRVSKNGGH